jgi:hypothetical protein
MTLSYRWTGDSFEILPRHAKLADEAFVIGEVYTLEEVKGRSQVSHNHYFASIHSAWLNLPELIAERFPTETHLRKYALIRTGYHDQRSIVSATKAEAQRIAAFTKPMDEFAVVVVSECTVTVYTAKSQSRKAMGGKVFQESKQAVMDFTSGMIGVTTEQLKKAETA